MKTKTKALVLTVSAVLLVVATVFATVAFLTDTDAVTNTFTVGKVDITLDEAKVDEYGEPVADAARVQANEYKLIPGHTYTKDPTIHVAEGSEKCWLFAKIENGLETAATLDISNTDWTLVEGTTNVYAYNTVASANDDAVVFTEFTFSGDADPKDYDGKTIVVTACAIQADGFATAEDAWNEVY